MDLAIKLHGYFRSSAAFRTRIALNLKGLDYASAFRHLRKNEQSAPDYLALNPQGLVPALEHDGSVLIQSLAIVEYLDEIHPEPPLLPATALGRARVRALADIIACDIHPLNNLRVLRYLRRPLGHEQPAIDIWYAHWIAIGFEALESLLAGSPETGHFAHGDTPGLADICLVPQVANALHMKCDVAPYPTIMRLYDTCMALPAFDRAAPKNQPDAEA